MLLPPSSFLLAACREPTPPPGPPYIAILAAFVVDEGISLVKQVRYTVEELSETLNINRSITVAPMDTVILSVPPASYLIEMHDLPATCTVRDGPKRLLTLLDTDNTGTLRYVVQCVPSLTVEILMDGSDLDEELVYRLTGPSGERVGLVSLPGDDSVHTRGDTLRFEGLQPGDYELTLSHVRENCVMLGHGPARRSFTLPPGGGGGLVFRIRCSENDRRPHFLSMASTYHDETSAFVFRVVDPDRDVRSYSWDLTDCKGNSVLPDKTPRVRRGLDAGRTYRADTLLAVGAYDVGIADSLLVGHCTAILVEDFRGNYSEYIQQPITAQRAGRAPEATLFNARLSGTAFIHTTLTASDPDGDFAGTFAAIHVRDGVLAPFDGNADIGILDPVGFLGTSIPNVQLGTRILWDDVYAIIVYLIDHAGNFRRLEDTNFFQ